MLEAFLEQLPTISGVSSLEIPAQFTDPNSVERLVDQLKSKDQITDLVFLHGELGRHDLHCFEDLIHIRSLRWVDSGERRRIPKGIFKIPNLQLLEFRQADFRAIPDEIGQLQKLRFFKFQGNGSGRKILEISEAIGQLSSLQILEISDVYVDRLPTTISALPNLEKLGVYNAERLYNLPDSLGQLPNLKVLELVNNSINTLPESIGNLSKLRALDLTDNSLTEFPESFKSLQNLEKLSLDGCRFIKHLPKGFEHLVSLKSLKLKNEGLNYEKALQQLAKLPNLEVLEILRYDDVPFAIPVDVKNMPALKWLRLKVGQMDSGQVLSVLSNIESLEYLDLRGFDLRALPADISGLANLKSVRLDLLALSDIEVAFVFSRLSELPILAHISLARSAKFIPREIALLQHLQSIDASNNPIHLLPKEMEQLRSLKQLNLKGCKVPVSELVQLQEQLPDLTVINE